MQTLNHGGASLLQFPNGDRFEGQTAGPNSPLQGTYFFRNGDRFQGNFRDGLKHGHGCYNYSSTGEVYEGQWEDDLWHGKGVYYLVGGEVKINGTWEKGIINGPAEVIHKNGDRFKGHFLNGGKEGEGEVFYGNGAYLKCQFSMDKPNGYGIFRYNPNTIYEGSFKNGLKSGTGSCYLI